MLIAGTETLINIEEIATMKVTKLSLDVVLKSGEVLNIFAGSPDYKEFINIFFDNSIPDRVVSIATLNQQKELMQRASVVNIKHAEVRLKLRLLEDQESLSDSEDMLKEIQRVGITQYRQQRAAQFNDPFQSKGLIKQ
jgi:hypothetical protein